jgi:hypothetical protein
MSDSTSPVSASPSIAPGSTSYVVHGQDGREITLSRLPSGSWNLQVSGPARDGTRRVSDRRTLGERLMREYLAACAVLHVRVRREGLPNA